MFVFGIQLNCSFDQQSALEDFKTLLNIDVGLQWETRCLPIPTGETYSSMNYPTDGDDKVLLAKPVYRTHAIVANSYLMCVRLQRCEQIPDTMLDVQHINPWLASAPLSTLLTRWTPLTWNTSGKLVFIPSLPSDISKIILDYTTTREWYGTQFVVQEKLPSCNPFRNMWSLTSVMKQMWIQELNTSLICRETNVETGQQTTLHINNIYLVVFTVQRTCLTHNKKTCELSFGHQQVFLSNGRIVHSKDLPSKQDHLRKGQTIIFAQREVFHDLYLCSEGTHFERRVEF
jgi:hypothetical protein